MRVRVRARVRVRMRVRVRDGVKPWWVSENKREES